MHKNKSAKPNAQITFICLAKSEIIIKFISETLVTALFSKRPLQDLFRHRIHPSHFPSYPLRTYNWLPPANKRPVDFLIN